MELTRRDAIAALAAAGVVGGGAALYAREDAYGEPDNHDAVGPLSDDEQRTLVAAAGVLYPSEVGNVEEFVTEYVGRRAADRPAHARGTAAAVQYLDEYSEAWYDEPYASLDEETREAVLRRMGADTTAPAPDGSDVERVRYYVVNELLFALYASPTGSELVGLENPQGHPGGLASYQRGPPS